MADWTTKNQKHTPGGSQRQSMPYRGHKAQIINWRLLREWLGSRLGLVHTAVRYQASRTNWQPPYWWRRLRLTWFRVALIGMVVLFFSRNQVRFKIDIVDRVGNPIASTTSGTATTVANQLGIASLPFSTQERETAFDPATIEATAVRTYVQRFSRVADTEYRKFGIPVPVKLAMAILESQAGQTRAAIDVNNHFGAVTEGSYYESAWANWRAHSQLIDQRYPQLKDLAYDADAWLDGLAKTNYRTDSKYVDQLRQVIRHFQLEG